ncbi:HEPN domain-containing protein [Pseudomonas brassicacearum]|uniref:HEPN domain-containing protein n=1 Tax=Pseudomonas brassicacearum TaxID=930166 RepID=UPI0011F35682|nr:HEPN domain-containing protein [Pseudomonas brassicacearum]QEO80226.1 hypothetical protein ELZ14_22770 [Pseudomonas brassicacearum]
MAPKHPNASTPSQKLIGQATRNLKKIEKQILRFLKMKPEELGAHFRSNRFSSLCSLEFSPQKELFYGLEGRLCFLELAQVLLKYAPDLEGKTNIDNVVRALKSAYLEQFVRAGKELEQDLVKGMLDLALSDIKSKFKKYVHYLPCILFVSPSPDSFSLGPVKFIKMPLFLVSNVPHEWVAFGDGAKPWEQSTVEYYKGFPWVASVEVEPCDFDSSFKVAVYACDTALNAIRVCFGSENTEWVRLSTGTSDDLRTARIWSFEGGQLQCSERFRIKSPSGPPNWYEWLNEGDGGRIKLFLGHVIEYACALVEHSELSSRLIDSVNWFGDACKEPSPAASVVKFVTAIERLYFASNEAGVKSRFVSRVSKILSDFELSAVSVAQQNASRIYDVRSTMVHGGSTQRISEAILPTSEAEDIARGCIMCAEQLYAVIVDAFDPKSPEALEAAMRIYEKEGLQWCINKARNMQSRATGET